ncbi:MAG: hypothetical protein HUJ26_18695 [Planctomycetaceae bacterium]|nr:hypothetical protein [Planctomycetaceae bacterium]
MKNDRHATDFSKFTDAERRETLRVVAKCRAQYRNQGLFNSGRSELDYVRVRAYNTHQISIPDCYLNLDEAILDLQGQLFAGDPNAAARREWRIAYRAGVTSQTEQQWVDTFRVDQNGGVVLDHQEASALPVTDVPAVDVSGQLAAMPGPLGDQMVPRDNPASSDAARAERKRFLAIQRFGEQLGLDEKFISRFTGSDTSFEDARKAMLQEFGKKASLEALGAEIESGEPGDSPEELFRQQYRLFDGKLGCSEDEYVQSCLETQDQTGLDCLTRI